MNQIGQMSSKNIQREILNRLKENLSIQDSKIVGSETLIFPTGDAEIFAGYFVEVISKLGQKIVDGAVRIYWQPFSLVDEAISNAASYETEKLKKWEMSALFIGFDKLDDNWPIGGIYLEDDSSIDEIVHRIYDFCEKHGKSQLDKISSTEGMFQYLQNSGPFSSGTWRITLDFLLRERLFGRSKSCENLKSNWLVNPTGYEQHQQSWLLANRCSNI